MSNFGKFLGGLVIGGSLGAIFGILLAPKSGEETRKQIADKTSNTYKKAENAIQDIQKKADKAIDDLQKSGQEVLKKVSDSLTKSETEEAKQSKSIEEPSAQISEHI